MNRPEPTGTFPFVALLALLALLLPAAPVWSQETADYFKKNCSSCHTIGGGRLTGPDLKNVTQRKDREWLTRFMLNPKAVIDSGDSYAQQLFEDYRQVLMPTLPDLTSERTDAILNLIEAESKLERSQFAGVTGIPDRPFTTAEIEKGRELFIGLTRLKKGGAACLSCHSVQGASATGGGMLGPDLTQVFNKLEGRKGLARWLSAPATPTMQPIFKDQELTDDEILHLVAYLESVKEGRAEVSTARFNFFLIGLAGTAGGFFLIDYIWRRRFRTVRRKLVNGDHETERA